MPSATRASSGSEQAGSIQVISRAATLLRALHEHPEGLALSKLADAVSLPRSTVHRILSALAAEGLVAAGPSGRMVLGPELARIAGQADMGVSRLMRPVLEGLFDELQETVDLAVLEGQRMRFIDQIPTSHRLRAVSAVGATFPLHCTANGKAVLALMTDDAARSLLPPRLKGFTPHTITTRAALMEELESIRATGLAYDREEHTEGICAIGFAVGTAPGLHAAITVPIPVSRFARQEQAITAALMAARQRAQAILA